MRERTFVHRQECAPHTFTDHIGILNNTSLPDVKLNALVTLVKELVRERGYASEASVQNFLAVGYRKEQVIELLLAIALKTISNYLDHISPAPIDQAFAVREND